MVIAPAAGLPVVRHKDTVCAGIDHHVGVLIHTAADAFDGVAGVHVGLTLSKTHLQIGPLLL